MATRRQQRNHAGLIVAGGRIRRRKSIETAGRVVAAKNMTLDALAFTAIGGAPITTQAGGSTLSSDTSVPAPVL